MYYGSQNWSQIYGTSGFPSCVNMTCLNQANACVLCNLGKTGWTLLLKEHLYVDVGARKLGTRDVFILGRNKPLCDVSPYRKQMHTTRHSPYFGNWILERGEGGGKSLERATHENTPFV
jgi:hypothetical protein